MKTSQKNYFTKETELAIVKYNNEEDIDIKNKIFENDIYYPFFKLTENIIHSFKFYYTDVENLSDLQHEIIQFLLKKIHKFDPDRGFKAYSYFGTIVKRYLIIYNKKNYKKHIEKIPINTLNDNPEFEYIVDDSNQKLNFFISKYLEYCYNNLEELFINKDELQIADAILTLFVERDLIEIFNKKALYIYIKEITNAKATKITKVSTKLKKIFSKNYIFYLENDYIKFN
jgi:hypothetical protein